MITRETIQKDQQAYWNNTFTHCPFSVRDNSTHTTSASSSATSTSSIPTGSMLPSQQRNELEPSNVLSTGAIAGIVIGCFAPLSLLVAFAVWYFRHKKSDNWEYSNLQLQPFLAPAPSEGKYMYLHDESFSTDTPLSLGPAPPTPGATSVPPTPSYPITPYTDAARPSTPPYQLARSYTDLTGSNAVPSTPSSSLPYPRSTSPTTMSAVSEYHSDAGVVLGRSASGRLPPAYGDQKYTNRS